jgi:DNA-3-methyladenine glycosylase II
MDVIKKADWWDNALSYLSDRDEIMKKIISTNKEDYLQSRGEPFNALCRTIIGQQISVKAAASIWNKFELGARKINPKSVIQYGNDNIRNCGISSRKVGYIIGLSNFFIKNPNVVTLWRKMDDKAVIKELCKLKGIGPWSSEMFLMFCLLRPDVLPLGDLGLRRAVGKNYLNTFDPTYEQVEKIAKQWMPYRSAATWFLWKSIDPIAVAY